MSITSVSYEDFSTSSETLVKYGGPWSATSIEEPDPAEICDNTPNGCDGLCLVCEVFPPADSLSAFHPSFNANISVNLANYGGAASLDFSWTYWPVYCGTNITAGPSIPIHSQVGDAGFNDKFPAVDYYQFFSGGHQWNNASKITHSASTSVVRGSDPTRGYIVLKINMTMTPLTNSHKEYLHWSMKGIGFKITTPLQNATPTSSNPTSSSDSTSQSDLHTVDPFSVETSSSSTFTLPIGGSSSPSSPTTIPVGAVAGATVGAVVFISPIIIALFLFRRQRGRENGQMADPIAFTEHVNDADTLPHEGRGPITPHWVGHSSTRPPLVGMEPNDRPTSSCLGQNASRKRPEAFQNTADSAAVLLAGTTLESGSGDPPLLGLNGLPLEMSPNIRRPLSTHSSSFSGMPYDPPPTYGPEESIRQDRTISSLFSPELARYASANRDVINEGLEARLQAAGYLPTDDPSNLTPEEWKNEYGITRPELRRLQDLYTRSR